MTTAAWDNRSHRVFQAEPCKYCGGLCIYATKGRRPAHGICA